MKIDVAKKLITVLLIILIVTLALTLFLIAKTGDDEPAETDTETTVADTDDGADTSDTDTDAPDTTVGGQDGTTASDTTAADTAKPDTTAPETSAPPVTTAPVDPPPATNLAPAGFSLSKTFSSESGAAINTRAVCTATRNSDGSVALTVEVYLVHYSLGIGQRTGKLKVGDTTVKFTTERISQSKNEKTYTHLYTFTDTYTYGETLDIHVTLPVNVTYGSEKKEIKDLVIETSLTLKK